jgi:hypothetical protein
MARKKESQPSPKLSEPIDRFVTEEELNAPPPSHQIIEYIGVGAEKIKFTPQPKAKIIRVYAKGTVVYVY